MIDVEDDEDFESEEEATGGASNDANRGLAVELAEKAQGQLRTAIAACKEADRRVREYRSTVEVDLPAAMAEAKMSDFSLYDGTSVAIRTDYTAGKLTDPVALDWVEANGGGYAIKTLIVLELPKTEVELARSIAKMLREHPQADKFITLELERSIHQSTMAALGRRFVEEKKNPDLALLGVNQRTQAVLGKRRPKTLEIKGFTDE